MFADENEAYRRSATSIPVATAIWDDSIPPLCVVLGVGLDSLRNVGTL